MKSRSPMKHRTRWLLTVAAVLAWGLQSDPAHELKAAQGGEAGRVSVSLNDVSRPPGAHGSWESLFAAGSW